MSAPHYAGQPRAPGDPVKVGQAFLPAAQTGMSTPRTGMSAPPAISALEAEIDRLVYDLYGLTASEVEIVEG